MRTAFRPLFPICLILSISSLAAGQERPVFAVDVSHWSGEITASDVACWEANDVEHVIPGTQVESITRQQLQTALDGGLSVDAYVVLYWDQDIGTQVRNALSIVRGFPIGRLWLDIEVYPGNRSVAELENLIQQGFDACGTTECGIYTGKWWWDAYMRGSTRFSHAPLWYAYYDNVASLGTWSWQAFGGWPFATGKQYGFSYLCGVNVDYNVMLVGSTPGGDPPPIPTGLASAVSSSSVTLSVASPTDAIAYDFRIEYWDGAAWQEYHTYQPSQPSQTFWPAFIDTGYRFQVRAQNAFGWSDWSSWSSFDFGTVGSVPPAPGVLSPIDGAVITAGSVTLDVEDVDGATLYEFEIEYWDGALWQTYYTYRPTGSQQTFWPAFANTAYRFRARAENAYGLGDWSGWSGFDFGSVPRVPPAPSPSSPEDGAVITTSSVTLAVEAITGATRYEFEIGYSDGVQWQSYYTYRPTTHQQKFWPVYEDTAYRWRTRAENGYGFGEWSVWSHLDFGNVGRLPPAPTGLSPDGGEVVTTSSVTLSADALADASRYEVEIHYFDGALWQNYYTYSPTVSRQTFWPAHHNVSYRWRIRGENGLGWGAWSDWALFDFGNVAGPPAAPTGMTPDDGAVVTTSSATLRVDAVSDATRYEFEIWYWDGVEWKYYVTYAPATNAQTFWPVYDDTFYLWRVRAENAHGWSAWSEDTTFAFGNIGPPPVAGGWAFPVGSADDGGGWFVSLGLGESWYSSFLGRWFRGHLGEDWFRSSGGTLGQPVYAAAAGEVVTVLQNCGNYVDVVILRHDVEGISESVYSFYGHIESDGYVSVGELVERRQQLGVIGDPVDFNPHLHFEVKNETALVSPPFSGCSSTGAGIYISAGYSGLSNDYGGGTFYDPTDSVAGNRYYNPTRFIDDRK